MVKLTTLPNGQRIQYPISQGCMLILLKKIEQDFITFSISIHFNHSIYLQHFLDFGGVGFVLPIGGQALRNNTARVLLERKLDEFFNNHLSYSRRFTLSEEFIAELNHVVAVGVLDDFIRVEGDRVDKVLSNFHNQGAMFLLLHPSHHVLQNTHGILVQSKGQKVLLSDPKELDNVVQGEYLHDGLNKMGGKWVDRQILIIWLYGVTDQLSKVVLLLLDEETDECLDGMGALFVPGDVGDMDGKFPHDVVPLRGSTDSKQLLHHVIGIFVRDEILQFLLKMLDYHFDFFLCSFVQVILKESRLHVIPHEGTQISSFYQLFQVHLLLLT